MGCGRVFIYLFNLWIFLLGVLCQCAKVTLQPLEELLGRLTARRAAGKGHLAAANASDVITRATTNRFCKGF